MTAESARLHALFGRHGAIVQDTVVAFTQALRAVDDAKTVDDLRLLRKIHMKNPGAAMTECRIAAHLARAAPRTASKASSGDASSGSGSSSSSDASDGGVAVRPTRTRRFKREVVTSPQSPKVSREDRVSAAKARLRRAAWQSTEFTVKHFHLVAPKVTAAMREEFPADLHHAVAVETRSLFEREGTPPTEHELAKAVVELTGITAANATR